MTDDIVGVVGAGTIGVGVAESLACSGCTVVLVDVCDERLADAIGRLRDNLRTARMLDGGRRGESTADVLARIKPTLVYAALAQATFVIENVFERWEVKAPVYAQLDAVCRPSCVFAANTSAIPIARLASATRRADRVIGLHFMNPAPRIATVEVIRGPDTAPETVARAGRLLARMGKQAIVVQDSPGFVANRILMLAINEAAGAVQRGVASATDVDRVFRECCGHPMGPLESADLIGLDTIVDTLDVLRELTADERFAASPILRQLVADGATGRKRGRGFFRYE